MKRFLWGYNLAKPNRTPSFLPKPISGFSDADIGTEISIPYND